jgi:nitrite reductase/ring-hydroxylating ferredoxin subunit/uncharacterized membrane protein
MRSKASIGSHPIHPMLISFPLAFLSGGFVFDLVGIMLVRPPLWSIGYYLTIVGVGTALVAAIPGFIDYFFTVPPASSGKERATKHMLAMLSVVGLFTTAWLLRSDAGTAPSTTTMLLEGLGAALLGVGGWLGGTLVSRNLISVDHRYAKAGAWSEESFDASPGQPVTVAKAGDLEVNQMKLLRVNGKRVVLGRTEEGYVAFDDSCTHKGGSLAGGVMICGTVQCLWHGSQFDVKNGKVQAGPAKQAIGTYRVSVRGSEVVLQMGEAAGSKPATPAKESPRQGSKATKSTAR